jgi:hypothetical protein
LSLVKTLILSGLLFVVSAGALGAEKPGGVAGLGQYRWKNRLLFLFSPSPETASYQTLSRELEQDSGGVRERDLLVFHVLERGPSFLGSREISPAEARALGQRFSIPQGAFAVVLVGKDGTVKLKRQGPTALADIFGLIDSMPMRQREMGGVTLD